ncbi:MAG TPA: hypothetical protein VFM55_05825 [Micromonosporaceae bacterium]|nr:hypothetical protein [Micromonosporaceae bacterium]
MPGRGRCRGRWPGPGRPARRELEYRGHGTVSLTAAMNVATGKVHPKIVSRNDSATFVAFLAELDQAIDEHLTSAGSSTTGPATSPRPPVPGWPSIPGSK